MMARASETPILPGHSPTAAMPLAAGVCPVLLREVEMLGWKMRALAATAVLGRWRLAAGEGLVALGAVLAGGGPSSPPGGGCTSGKASGCAFPAEFCVWRFHGWVGA